MKILHIIHQFYPMHYTGTEKFLLNLSLAIQRWSHNVKVVTYSYYENSFYSQTKGNILFHDFTYRGIPIIAYKHRENPIDLDFALECPELSEFADEIISREKPDLLHVAHSLRTAEFINAALRHGIPYLLTLTDFWLLCPKCILYTSKGSLCSGPMKGKTCIQLCPEFSHESISHRYKHAEDILYNAQRVIAPSRFLGGIFQNEFADLTLSHIPYGIDYSRIKRNTKHYVKDALNFTYAGQIAYHKGVHVLIEAFKKLSFKNIMLNLYGSGLPDQEYHLKQIASDDPRIQFRGVYNETQVGDILQCSDIVVIPSNWHENNTITMREALACNVPVIVSDAGGMTEVVKDSVNGFVFRMGDSKHLNEIMEKVIQDPKILNPLKQNINSTMMMAVEQEAFAYLQNYQACLRNSGGGIKFYSGNRFNTSSAVSFASNAQQALPHLNNNFVVKLCQNGKMGQIVLNMLRNIRRAIRIFKIQFCKRRLLGLFDSIRIARRGELSSAMPELPFVSANPVDIVPLLEDKGPENVKPGVSVLIPTFNGAEDFLKLLLAVRNQKGFKNIEIVVVDSGSADETINYAQEFGAKIVQIQPEEFSHSYSRNLCAEYATEDYLLFTTQDALPSSDLWVYNMVTAMEDHDVEAVSCIEIPRIDADIYTRVALWWHANYFLEINGNDKIISMPLNQNPNSLRKHAQLTSIGLLVKKETFFKYKFRKEYAEDLDLGVRLLTDGGKIALLSSNPVVHSHNRPPFYHLKRAYIDKLVIAEILNERLDEPGIQYNELVGDIVKTYRIISSVRVADILNGRRHINITELDAIITKIRDMDMKNISSNVIIENNLYLDTNIILFLKKVFAQYQKSPSEYSASGLLLKELIQFLTLSNQYIKTTHEYLDESFLNDYFTLIFKSFANSVGAYAAICYANTGIKEYSPIQMIHSELMDKRILWE